MKTAYIVETVRTPIGRFGGALSGVRPDDLAALSITALLSRMPSLDPALIDEVILGCANQAGEDNRNVARMAALLAGLPETVPGSTVNRLCGSGLDAISTAARAITAGECDLIIAGGVESMSRAPFVMGKAETPFSRHAEIFDTTIGWRFVNGRMKEKYGVDSMPETGENVAEQFQISREDQDAFAARSHEKANLAIQSGRLSREIVPVEISQRKGGSILFEQDEHPRLGTTAEKLANLPTPFRKGGSVTAGNASGVNDGSAALLIASENACERFGLAPKAKIVGTATAGVPPRIMGIGPAPASRKLMDRFGWTMTDFDIIELNEAFASQAIAVLRELGVSPNSDYVNPNGGAIALGHPLGMSGARIAGSAAMELAESGAKRALCTMCIGVGQGIAMALERV